MFLETFQITLVATCQVLLMGVCGFVLVKREIIHSLGLGQLSRLVVNLLLPFFIFFQLTRHFRFDEYPNWWIFPLISFGVTAGGYCIGRFVLLFDRKVDFKNEFLALTSFQNSGNIPLMIVLALFSGTMRHKLYVYIFLFTIGFNLLLWTLGVCLLVKRKTSEIDFKKALTPPFITTVATLVIIFLGWHRIVPKMILKPVELLGDCALPLAMLVVGGNLACVNLMDINKRALGLMILAKMILLPLSAFGIVLGLRTDFSVGFIVMIETAVPCAVSLSLITRYYNIEEKLISQGLFFSHVVSVLTIPLFLTFYMKLSDVF